MLVMLEAKQNAKCPPGAGLMFSREIKATTSLQRRRGADLMILREGKAITSLQNAVGELV